MAASMNQSLSISGYCKNCRHDHKANPYLKERPDLQNKSICTNRYCFCNSFEPVTNFDYLHKETLDYYQDKLNELKNTTAKVEWLLTNIPDSRDFDEWAFLRLYWHFCYGFTQGSIFTAQMVLTLGHPSPEIIRRVKQGICHKELEKWRNHELDLKDAKYLPHDESILIARGIKQKAFHDYSFLVKSLLPENSQQQTLENYLGAVA